MRAAYDFARCRNPRRTASCALRQREPGVWLDAARLRSWSAVREGMSIARLEGDVSTIEADMQSPSLGQPAPTVFEATRNVVSLLGAHAALVGFWALVLEAPLGLPLVWLAPLACVLHQKAMSE